jgi:uncharacterized membrane protein YfcA
MRRERVDDPGARRAARLGAAVAAATVSIVGLGWIASQATRQEALAGAIAIAVILVWYLAARRRRFESRIPDRGP